MKEPDDVTRRGEAGFSLIEAMMAMIILSFGLISVTNLFLVAGSSNQVANMSTAATAQASDVMERLKAIPFLQLTTGGNLDASCDSACVDTNSNNCVVPGGFRMVRALRGTGASYSGARICTRWTIARPGGGGPDTLYIVVRSEALGGLGGGVRSRAEFKVFRTCTASNCPQ